MKLRIKIELTRKFIFDNKRNPLWAFLKSIHPMKTPLELTDTHCYIGETRTKYRYSKALRQWLARYRPDRTTNPLVTWIGIDKGDK